VVDGSGDVVDDPAPEVEDGVLEGAKVVVVAGACAD